MTTTNSPASRATLCDLTVQTLVALFLNSESVDDSTRSRDYATAMSVTCDCVFLVHGDRYVDRYVSAVDPCDTRDAADFHDVFDAINAMSDAAATDFAGSQAAFADWLDAALSCIGAAAGRDEHAVALLESLATAAAGSNNPDVRAVARRHLTRN